MDDRMLTRFEVMALFKYSSESGFWKFCKKNPDFPKQIQWGLRRVAWSKREIDEYIAKKMNERSAGEVRGYE